MHFLGLNQAGFDRDRNTKQEEARPESIFDANFEGCREAQQRGAARKHRSLAAAFPSSASCFSCVSSCFATTDSLGVSFPQDNTIVSGSAKSRPRMRVTSDANQRQTPPSWHDSPTHTRSHKTPRTRSTLSP